ncbi:MAG: flagellar basal body rod protein FlgB [Pseudomonadota bacterium]
MIRDLLGSTHALLEHVLDRSAFRHQLLSSNIANVDTPGYLPVDLAEVDNSPGGLATEASDPRHLGGPDDEGEPVYDLRSLPGLDRNAVDLDVEMAKLAANNERFSAATRMISKKLAMLRYAIEGDR